MQRQEEIFQAMEKPDFYPHAVQSIEQRETHISKVFLTGVFVYKIKKPVNLGFLDFTTLENRRHFCNREVTLNRRLSTDVYLDVVAVVFRQGRYHLGGSGRVDEYAVKMRQLPQERSMVHLLRKGKIGAQDIDDLARLLAAFYKEAATGEHINSYGSWETVWTNTEENFRQTEPFLGPILEQRKYQIVRAATRSFLRRWRELFEHRIKRGKIRDCHGDLRTGHIYFADTIQIIDCIEFNDRFRYGDITSDLAFLAMDMDCDGYPLEAQRLIEAYARYAKDPNVFVLLDFYKCYRAFVRVKVNCFRLAETDVGQDERAKLLDETRRYMDLAYRYAVQFSRHTLWVVCGMPASGKSTIAAELGRAMEAKVFRSDVIRKELFGLEPERYADASFEQGIYSKGSSSLTYGKLLLLAQDEIEKGCSVVIDATYGSKHRRREVLRLARDTDANLIFVECVCPDALLKGRLLEREGTSLVSDARIRHFEQLKARFEPLEELREDMHIRVDTQMPLDESLEQILSQDYVLECRQSAEAMKR